MVNYRREEASLLETSHAGWQPRDHAPGRSPDSSPRHPAAIPTLMTRPSNARPAGAITRSYAGRKGTGGGGLVKFPFTRSNRQSCPGRRFFDGSNSYATILSTASKKTNHTTAAAPRRHQSNHLRRNPGRRNPRGCCCRKLREQLCLPEAAVFAGLQRDLIEAVRGLAVGVVL